MTAEMVEKVEFANAFDAALEARGLSLAEVREQLLRRGEELSIATLSYWRSGVRHPDPVKSAAALAALEAVLQTLPGALSGRAPAHSRRLGAVGRVVERPVTDSARSRILELLDVTPIENYRTLSIAETIDIDDSLALRAVETTLIVQCVRGTLDSLGFVHATGRTALRGPNLVVLAGGTVTAEVTDAARTSFAHRVELERPLEQGETTMIDMRKTLPDAHPAQRSHFISVPRRTREVLQWFRFDQDFPPDWFDEVETRERTRTVTLSEPRSVHRWRVDFGPGEVLARWGYVDDA
ncbi:MAG: hypothetical protein WA971_05145 [Microbacterium sp.]